MPTDRRATFPRGRPRDGHPRYGPYGPRIPFNGSDATTTAANDAAPDAHPDGQAGTRPGTQRSSRRARNAPRAPDGSFTPGFVLLLQHNLSFLSPAQRVEVIEPFLPELTGQPGPRRRADGTIMPMNEQQAEDRLPPGHVAPPRNAFMSQSRPQFIQTLAQLDGENGVQVDRPDERNGVAPLVNNGESRQDAGTSSRFPVQDQSNSVSIHYL